MKESLSSRLQKIGINGLLLGILGSVVLAYFFPDYGDSESLFPWPLIIDIGITLVFFLYGLKLNPESLKKGLKNYRLHLVIQGATYLVFPLIVWTTLQLLPKIDPDLALGLIYISALPSTVSAAVVLISIAKGNIPAAIFNASISSLLGVLITPFWMIVLADSDSAQLEILPTLYALSLKILLPVFLGMLFHRWLFPLIQPLLSKLKYVDQLVIMCIVFSSFSNSFTEGIFDPYEISTLLLLSLGLVGLYGVVFGMLYLIGKARNFPKEDKITLVFCGVQKSLVQGAVMGKVFFPDPAVLALVLLPLMIYHIQQLIIGSAIAGFLGEQKNKP